MIQKTLNTWATKLLDQELSNYPTAVILPNFTRSIQLDIWNCAGHSVYTILRYFGRRSTPKSLAKQLGTDFWKTTPRDMKRVIRARRLSASERTEIRIQDLKIAIDSGSPVLMTIGNGWHYCVDFGIGPRHVFVMDPMMLGSLRVALFTSRLRSYVNNRVLTRMKNESPEYIRASVCVLNTVD